MVEFRGQIDKFEGSTLDLLRLMVFKGWWERIGSTRISGIPKLILSEARNFPEIARFYVAEVVRAGPRNAGRRSSSAASSAANSAPSTSRHRAPAGRADAADLAVAQRAGAAARDEKIDPRR